MAKQPPSKELFLHLAEIYYEMGMPQRSWQFLLCWAAYEDYIELYWEDA
jgi:hypothetical protein